MSVRAIPPLLSLFVLTACAVTLPVVGQITGSGEMLRGEATGSLDGSGMLTIRTESGRKCAGKFQYAPSRTSGEGTFSCDDAGTGDFYFTSAGMSGEGFGKLSDGTQFRFRFGDPARDAAAFAAFGEGLKAMGEGIKANQPQRPVFTNCSTSPFGGTTHCTTY